MLGVGVVILLVACVAECVGAHLGDVAGCHSRILGKLRSLRAAGIFSYVLARAAILEASRYLEVVCSSGLELLATLRYLGGAMGIAFGKILWRCIAKIAGW